MTEQVSDDSFQYGGLIAVSKKSLQSKPWYPMAVAACIAVVLLVFLMRFDSVWFAVRRFFSYFSPVILAIVIAYLVNPLAVFYRDRLFGRIKRKKTKHVLSVALAFITVLLMVSFLLMTLIPQLIDSISMFAGNIEGYIDSLNDMLRRWGVNLQDLKIEEFISSSEALLKTLTKFISDNISEILSTSASAGRSVIEVVIAFMLSIYFLAAKDKLRPGLNRLLKVCIKEEKMPEVMHFFRRCNKILNRYIVYNVLDSLIVGIVNAIFMVILRMPYVGLVSFVVALFNLIPTFGPIIGAVIGAFVLVMIKPWHALAFLIFTIVLQTADAYYIKPKIFGDTLGVSGLWILVGIIVGGRMFGVVGILLAIPAVAILDFSYGEYLLPWLEERRRKRDEQAAKEKVPENDPDGAPAPSPETDPDNII
jgi:predicted PurR-regulated permease PerM